jgi:hypothetical protein
MDAHHCKQLLSPTPTGVISSVGVHTAPAFPFTPVEAYDKNVTLRCGRCPARAYMPRLLDVSPAAELPARPLHTAQVLCVHVMSRPYLCLSLVRFVHLPLGCFPCSSCESLRRSPPRVRTRCPGGGSSRTACRCHKAQTYTRCLRNAKRAASRLFWIPGRKWRGSGRCRTCCDEQTDALLPCPSHLQCKGRTPCSRPQRHDRSTRRRA